MVNKTAVVYSCAHSDPSVGNERFDWLGIMGILLLKSWPVLLLSVIVINSIITIRLMLALRRLMVLWWVASKERKKAGQGKLTVSGGRVW